MSKLTEVLSDGRILGDFLDDLAFRKRSRPRTVQAYRRDLRKFCKFIESERKKSVTECMREDVLEFISICRKAEESPGTITRRLSSIRNLFGWLVRTGRITESPVTGLKGFTPPRSLPKVLSRDEIDRLFEAGRSGTKVNRRAGMMLELMYATGLRISEVTGLRMEHLLLDDENPVIMVIDGKGGKASMSPLPDRTIASMGKYLDEVRPLILSEANSPFVFPTGSGKRVSRQGAWKDIKSLGRAAGIETRLHPHLLRHTCATHLLESGCDLRTVQEILSHADISTTEIYTHILKKRKRKVFYNAHPRAKAEGKGRQDG